jgi:hypothetical protein
MQMSGRRASRAVVVLLVTAVLLWSTTLQAFSFCFSFGSKGRGGAYSQARHYRPYAAWPPPLPVIPYSYLPYRDYQAPVRQDEAGIEMAAPPENQGLDYIIQ